MGGTDCMSCWYAVVALLWVGINLCRSDITATHNVCIVSIPTVFDPSLAPPGKAVVHAYYAANEPYEVRDGNSMCFSSLSKEAVSRMCGLQRARFLVQLKGALQVSQA
jgi:hypothetical protein